jgi:hypothetical protein
LCLGNPRYRGVKIFERAWSILEIASTGSYSRG